MDHKRFIIFITLLFSLKSRDGLNAAGISEMFPSQVQKPQKE